MPADDGQTTSDINHSQLTVHHSPLPIPFPGWPDRAADESWFVACLKPIKE
jgi:hypothetical protein